MDREAAVTVALPPHLQAEPDVAGFEHVRAAVVLDRVPLGDERFPGAGLHVGQDAAHRGEVGCRRDVLVSGPVQHLRELLAQGPDGPADGIAIDDRIHPAVHAHAAADPAGGRQFGIFRAVDIASLDVEAVEAQQRGLLAVDIGRHVDGYTLVDMILDIAIPQLVSDDEGQRIGGKSGSLRLWHVGTLLLDGFATSLGRRRGGRKSGLCGVWVNRPDFRHGTPGRCHGGGAARADIRCGPAAFLPRCW